MGEITDIKRIGTSTFSCSKYLQIEEIAMAFEQPKLPYAEDALEPVLSKHEVHLHYAKHAAAYFKKTNDLIKGTVYERADTLDDIINKDALASMDSKLFNHACQAWNHVFYFDNMAPESEGGEPSSELLAAIIADFGSMEEFKKKFSEAATEQFGSGWAWLIWKSDKLIIKTTPNARNPLTDAGQTPLLTMDVWEHAYTYDPQYAADRKTYVHNMWKIINWKVVSDRFEKATK